MIRTYQSIIGTQIVQQDNGELLGMLYDIIIDPENGKVEAFWVKPATIPIMNGILRTEDILKWNQKIYIANDSKIAEPEDVIRITQILEKNTLFIDNQVLNQDDQFIGYIYDLDFDDKIFSLKNIYTHKLLILFSTHKRVFDYQLILKASPEAIWVNDDSRKKVEEGVLEKPPAPLADI